MMGLRCLLMRSSSRLVSNESCEKSKRHVFALLLGLEISSTRSESSGEASKPTSMPI